MFKSENISGSVPKGKVKVRKSASLILLMPFASALFNYKILFIRRPKKMSFSDMFAFPGGALDVEDSAHAKSLGIDALQYCALRETFEETGIYAPGLNITREKLAQLRQASSSKGEQYDFELAIKHLGFDSQAVKSDQRQTALNAFIRFITVQKMPYRFDTQFYLADISKLSACNYGVHDQNTLQYQFKISDFDTLNCSKQEVVQYLWLDPADCLNKYYKREINLAVPQVLILSILCSFSSIEELTANLQNRITDNCQQQREKDGSNTLDTLPYTFPQQISFESVKQGDSVERLAGLLPGDHGYPLNELLKDEEDELGTEMKHLFANIVTQPGQLCRFYIDKGSDSFRDLSFEVQVNMPHFTLFKYLQGGEQLKQLIAQRNGKL